MQGCEVLGEHPCIPAVRGGVLPPQSAGLLSQELTDHSEQIRPLPFVLLFHLNPL